MTLADDVRRVLPELRREAEARMESTANVYHAGGKTTDDDGFEVDGWTPVLTAVPFRLGGSEAGSSGTRRVTVGGSETQVAVRIGHFPVTTTGIRDNDVIEITAGENAGRYLRVIEAMGADQQTALRLPVFEVAKPAGL